MIKLKAYAKLNLNLHVMPQPFKNGLYPVRFINCQLDLHDDLSFERISNKIEIISNHSQLPKTGSNLIYKAAVLLKKNINDPGLGAVIRLKKNIPVKAGLAGGSSDGAATLKGLIKLWRIKITQSQLLKIAGQLGKDVFYCLKGGLGEVLSDGEVVNDLKLTLPKLFLVIIVPDKKKPSTGWMYQNLNKEAIGRNLGKFEKFKKAIILKNKKEIISNLFNDFESLAINNFPSVAKISGDLIESGASKTLLMGSGLAVAGFFEGEKKTKAAFGNLKVKYKNILWTKTI